MKNWKTLMVTLFFLGSLANFAIAATAEDANKSAPASASTQEKAKMKPYGLAMSRVIESYIKIRSKDGIFPFKDDTTGQIRNLELIGLHPDVQEAGDNYFQCVDFKDIDTGEAVDVDVEVSNTQGVLAAVGAFIHQVDKVERFKYDEKHNRVAVVPAPSIASQDSSAKESEAQKRYGY